MTPDENLERLCGRLGLSLPQVPKPVGVYRPVMITGGFAFLSGQISKDAQGKVITGKIGADLRLEEGKNAARWASLQALSLIRAEMGLDRVEGLARLVGYVQSSADFHQQSDVMNAASEIFLEVFGEAGRHARTSVGVASLPLDASVEIELTLKLQ